jgi:predicted permease
MTLAMALIRVLRPFAPRTVRDRWAEEWRAEIAHAAAATAGRRWPGLRLLRFTAGAIPDLIALRRLPSPVLADRSGWLQGIHQDFHHAGRSLSATPWFTATVVASLSLGVVVLSGAYAFINAALFPKLPGVRDQHLLIEIYMERSALDDRTTLRDAIPGVRDVATTMPSSFAVSARDHVLSVQGAIVSANYFDVLGTLMRTGRGFLPREDRPADGASAVLGSALSRRLFGEGSPVGEFITLGGYPVQIVGVVDEGFRGTYLSFDFHADIWVAWGMADRLDAAGREFLGSPPAVGEFEMTHVARVSSAASVQDVLNQARLVAPRLVSARIGAARRPFTRARRVGRDDGDGAMLGIALLLFVPGLVLLIGCINAATLLLARGTQQIRDIAIRLALGASRWRIVRQLLAESLLLALVAAAVTLPLLAWTLKMFESVVWARLDVDIRVAVFAVLVSCASVIVFGLAPAMRISAPGHVSTLGSRTGDTRRTSRTRQVLVAVQVALSLGLLATGSQLLAAVRLQAGVTGVQDPSRLLMVSFDLSQLNASQARAETFYSGLLERVQRLPGVERAGLAAADAVWVLGSGRDWNNSVAAWPLDTPPNRGHVLLGGYAGGDLIETVGLHLVDGRLFTPADRTGSPRVAILNRTAADQFFGGHAIGRSIRVAPRGGSYETSREVAIVGVIEPALDPEYARDPLDPTVPAIYLPERLAHQPALALYVRTRANAPPLLPAVQKAASGLEPLVPVVDSETLAQRRDERQIEARLAAQGLTLLGGLGLALAACGLYGMVAFIIALKRREIGVRMALGAHPRRILRLMMAQGIRTALVGAGIGGVFALGLSGMLRAQMFGVPPIDPVALLAASALLLAVVVVASLIPARNASRVDPLIVLRDE